MKTKLQKCEVKRRDFLKGLSGTAGLAILGIVPGISHAQSKGTIIVGAWGGSYGELLHESIGEAILIPNGWKVVQANGGAATRSAKLLAGRSRPKGQSDIQAFDGTDMYRLYQNGVLQEIDYSRINNAKHILKTARFKYGVGQIYSALIPIFNPKTVQKKPRSFKDVYDPTHGRNLAILTEHYYSETLAAAVAAGGSATNFEPGKELLLKCVEAGARVYSQQDLYVQGFKNEEFNIGTNWKARAYSWKKIGLPIESIYPAEGGVYTMFGFVIPKNAPSTDAAYAYINAMLDPEAGINFAKKMGYNPVIDNADIDNELKKAIGFTEEEIKKFNRLDYEYFLEHDADLREWWARNVGSPG